MAGGGMPDLGEDSEEAGGFVEPNIVPLVDIMLVLLVILMAGSSAIVQAGGGTGDASGSGFRVNLPSGTGDQTVEAITDELIITVLPTGEAVLDEDVLMAEQLEARLQAAASANPERLVLVQADEQTPHVRVVEVMEAIRRAGLANIAIATRARDSDP